MKLIKKYSSNLAVASTILLSLVALFVFASTLHVSAADVKYPNDSSGNLEVPASVSSRNLYSFAQNLQVNTDVKKDAVVAAQNITFTGAVGDDLIAAGMNLELNGTVGGTLRAAGEEININRPIGDDVVVAAKDINISSTSSVNGDILAAAKTMQINAPVHGNISFTGGKLYINSEVGGSIFAKGQSIELGPNAVIHGSINYAAVSAITINSAAKVQGQVNRSALPQTEDAGSNLLVRLVALVFICLIQIVGLFVLFAIFKKPVTAVVEKSNSSYWNSLLIGLILTIVMPIVAIILCLTFFGIYLGIVMFFSWILLMTLGWAIGTISFGVWLEAILKRKPQSVHFYAIAIGVVIASLIRLIPVIGFIFSLILILAGVGAIAEMFWRLNKNVE